MGTSAPAYSAAPKVLEQRIGDLKVTALPFGPMAPNGPAEIAP